MGCQLLRGEVLGFMDVAAHFGSINRIHWVINKEQERKRKRKRKKKSKEKRWEGNVLNEMFRGSGMGNWGGYYQNILHTYMKLPRYII